VTSILWRRLDRPGHEAALEPLEQTYERIGERVVRYTSATGFTADIEVNEDGFPVHYPGLAVNVLSQSSSSR